MKLTLLRTTLALLAAGALLAALLPASSGAVVPPRNCGKMTVKGKRWQVKVDQVRCKQGRRLSRRYIKRGRMTSAYRCRRGDRGSAIYAQCTASRYNPDRVIFIFRR